MQTDQPENRHRGISFSVTLSAAMAVLVLSAVAVVFWLQWSAAQESTQELIGDKAELVLGQIEQHIRTLTDPAARQVTFMADRVAQGKMAIDDHPMLSELLIASLAANQSILIALFIDTNRFTVNNMRRPNGSFQTQIRPARDDAREFVDSILSQGKSAPGRFWGRLFYSKWRNTVFINVWHPVRRNGAYLGVFGAGASLAQLSSIVTKAAGKHGGTGFVLHGPQQVLAHPMMAVSGSAQADNSPTLPLAEFPDAALADIWGENATLLPNDEYKVDEGEIRWVRGRGSDYVLFTRALDDFGKTPWIIGVWFPADEIIAPWKRIVDAAYVAAASLAVAVLIALMLGVAIARPIRRVARSASKIGNLDLADVEDLPPSLISEIDEQAGAFNRMLAGLRVFETYVPRTLVRRLIQRGQGAMQSDERVLSVMFTDIAGFTTMAEKMAAAELGDFLNEHMSLIGAGVEQEGGTIDKYIGDAVMAFWGAPDDMPDSAARACRAALAIRDAIEQDNVNRRKKGKPAVRVRIGVHTGKVLVGNIGAPGRINYTIVGDTVNTCQRIEALGKTYGLEGEEVTILISGDTAEKIESEIAATPVGTCEIRGRTEPMDIYRLDAPSAKPV